MKGIQIKFNHAAVNIFTSAIEVNIPSIMNWVDLLNVKGVRLSNENFNDLYDLLVSSRELKTKCTTQNFPKWHKKLNTIFPYNSFMMVFYRVLFD